METLASVFREKDSCISADNGVPKRNELPDTLQPPKVRRKKVQAFVDARRLAV